jgi:hypothetical protein
MKKYFIPLIAAGFLLSSCSRDNGSNNPINNNPESFEELQVSNSFDWSTTQEVTLQIEGLPNMLQTVSRVMRISNSQGKTLAKKVIRMDESSSITLELPKAQSELTVEYGTIEKTVSIQGKSARFSFIPVDNKSDLDPADR